MLSGEFCRRAGMRIGVLIFPALLSAGCANKELIRTERIDPDTCGIFAHEQERVNGLLVRDEVFESRDNPYATRCGGEREEALRQLYATQARSVLFHKTIDVYMSKLALDLKIPERERGARQQLISLIDSKDLGISDAAQAYLGKHNISERALRERVAEDEISKRFDVLQLAGGQMDVAATAAIIGLYYQDSFKDEQKRYPKLEQAFLREVIEGELQAAGLNMSDLEAAYTAGVVRQNACRDIAGENGLRYSSCGLE